MPNLRISFDVRGPEYKEMDVKVEMTWGTLRTISHSLMVHAKVLEEYIHFVLMDF